MKWITGPALITVLALRGLKEGDFVKLKPCDKRCAADPNTCLNMHYGYASKDFFTRPLVLFIEDNEMYPNDDRELPGAYTGRMARYYGKALGLYHYEGRHLDHLGTVVGQRNIRALRFAK